MGFLLYRDSFYLQLTFKKICLSLFFLHFVACGAYRIMTHFINSLHEILIFITKVLFLEVCC